MKFPLVGNVKLALAVENVLKERRLPHAILIDGDCGTGRHTLAHFLCKATVCSGESIPCDNCHNCHLAETHNHPDITVVAPEEGKKNIAVGQIRDLKANAYIKPHQADSKVFIIDFADTMNEQSQNALLKVLEEPPANTVFILIAESKASLLDTVISRCVAFSLNVPTLDEAADYLSDTTKFDLEEIENALKSTRNNIGKALMLLNGVAYSKTSLAVKEFLMSALSGDQWGMLNSTYPFEKNRIEADRFLKDLKLVVAAEIKKNTNSVLAPSLLKFYNKVTELEGTLITNINLTLLFADLTAAAKKCI
ncbi:MAG: DNA polymerase III subunit delta' [Clostridia bacterium]|nr:DNA polymerase III subunit delta' [Clostridia bacterium]